MDPACAGRVQGAPCLQPVGGIFAIVKSFRLPGFAPTNDLLRWYCAKTRSASIQKNRMNISADAGVTLVEARKIGRVTRAFLVCGNHDLRAGCPALNRAGIADPGTVVGKNRVTAGGGPSVGAVSTANDVAAV
jgi:hypothetical protein